MFKKSLLAVFLILTLTVSPVLAKKRGGAKGGISDKEITEITQTVNNLTKKIYASSLFSPQENEQLVDIKLKMDFAMLTGANPSFAPLYYKAGLIYKEREFRDEAIECFQTILENFSDTALAPKAKKELISMGITIQESEDEEEE